MSATRVTSQDIKDTGVATADLADASVTLAKLAALTTKGDLLGFDTAHARLGVGADGKFLKADSAAGVGVAWATIAASDVGSGAALTRVSDTNVTLTLGGSPTTALLAAASITAGWSGQLGLSRGGTNADLSATGGTSQVLKQASAGAAITVGQLAFSDISGSVTDAQVPNTITLDNLTQITTRAHASLSSLSADDHTQYALLVGRAGSQTLVGGTASGEDLILQSTAHATRGTLQFVDAVDLATSYATLSAATNVLKFQQNLTLDNVASALAVLNVLGTWTATTGFLNFHRLFNVSPTLTNAAPNALAVIPSMMSLYHEPTYTAALVNSLVSADVAVRHSTIWNKSGSGTYNGASTTGLNSLIAVDTGLVVSSRTVVAMTPNSGAGTVVTDIGLDVGAITAFTRGAAVRSAITSNGTINYLIEDTGGAPMKLIGCEIQSFAPTSQTIPTENFVLHVHELQLTGTQEIAIQGTAILFIL